VISASTWAFTFSTPASANTTGVVSEEHPRRLASSSTATLVPGANVSATRHARIRREKLSAHGVEIRARPVQQPDDRGVNVPHLVGTCRPQTHLRLRRVHAEPGTPPAVRPYEAVPGGRRGPDRPEPLGQDGERAGRDVPVRRRGHHGLDDPDFDDREPMRRGARTG
jgi:hypothetical protein